ncbi:MAG TPA: hypothetical protein VNH64_08655, partial [Parvularculaceae bacterium]|nr:hypothetical protein [Parvularculaceae bacterium]
EMIVLSSMCATCTFGIYILQRYRRTDFLKTKTIARQNEQLAGMLADAQLDNERKLAALNTLIHFVKTPIHQIVGFTDLIVKGLQGAPGQNVESQLEHAQFVKSASADLSANVARLLAYYRLDEEVKGEAPAKVSLASALDDFKDLVEAKVECAIESRPPELVSHAGPIRVAITSLASLCTAEESEIKTALIQWRDNKRGGIDLIFDFDGPTLTDERFADLTQPLTKLTNYLTSEGRAMPMTLRTVARAADICGGRFTYRREGRRNIFTLSLVDLSDSRAGVAIGKEGAAA